MNEYKSLSKEDLVAKVQELESLLTETNRKLEDQRMMLDVLETTDDLTKLLNRRAAYILLEEEINRARRYGTPLSVLLIDIDHIDEVQDRYGDQQRDTVFIKVAAAIKYQIRKVDVAGRYADDTVLVIFPNTGANDAQIISERLKESVQELAFEGELKVTISGGLKTYEGEDVLEFLNTTYEMLSQAKDRGGHWIETKKPA